jgi:hypothetical protein
LRPPALFCCYNRTGLEDATDTTPHGELYVAQHVLDTTVSIIRSFPPLHMQPLVTVWCSVSCVLQPCSVVTNSVVTTEQGLRAQPTLHHTVTRGCMCSGGKLLMMDTVVSETCRAKQSEIKFYDFKTDEHLTGFYSILSLMMHGAMSVKSHTYCHHYRYNLLCFSFMTNLLF